jgi:signal transduction histidine kinase
MSVDITKINYAILIISGIVIFIIVLLLFFVALYRKRHNFFLKEKELIEARHAQILLESQLEMQENIFTQISREIHDNIGQLLSLVRLNINTIDLKNLEEKLSFTDELLGRAIGDLRDLSHSLNTTYILEAGLVAAMGKLLESLQKTGQFAVSFEPNDVQLDLGNEKTIVLFRIIQEIINNIIKHANATQVDCRIEQEGGKSRITIADNGEGFDTAAAARRGNGLGISNMYQRAKMIPAVIDITSTPGKGTLFSITISPPYATSNYGSPGR